MIDEAAHAAEVEAWRATRYGALRRDLGWLTLAGFAWLGPGQNRVGTAADADIVLPAGPAQAGTITVGPDGPVADGRFRRDGAPVDHLRLVTDRDGDPTVLEVGSLRLCVIERGGRLAVRMWDLEHPRRAAFAGIAHWPVDGRWRIDARFDATPDRTIVVPDVLGIAEPTPSPGDVVVEIAGVEHRLQALEGSADGALWLVFADATNGTETYGGGRFVYTAPPAEGTVVVDFNRAYNPPCVFSPYATCPLPWPQNRLAVRVEAGEQSDVLIAAEPGAGR